jgi:hypothetical protein
MLGCGAAAAAAFVLIGVIAILRTGAPAECPGLLPYDPATYEPVGTPMAEPAIAGVDGALENAGEVSFGLAKWTAYVPPGMVPAPSGGILPPRIVLDCRDGTFQEFQRGTG